MYSVLWRKYKRDYKRLKDLDDGQPITWLKAPWNSHHWVDMFVEADRAAPYLMGHIWAVYFPVSVIGLAYFYGH
jgi:hypothetical protein